MSDYEHEEPRPENLFLHPNRCVMDLPVVDILRGAYDANLDECIVVGVRKDGREFVSATSSDASISIYYLQRAIHTLNTCMDEIQADLQMAAATGGEPKGVA